MFVDGSRTLRTMYEQGRGSYINEYDTPDQIIKKVQSGGEECILGRGKWCKRSEKNYTILID